MQSRFFGMSALVAFVGVCNAIGCGTSAGKNDEPAARTGQSIQGGTADTTHTFEVGVCGGSPGQCQLLCTGTLIAPNLVVTARHCVSQTPSGSVDCAATNFGAQYNPSQYYITTSSTMLSSAGTWVRAKEFVTPTPTALCGNDIALIILTSNVPASAATPAIPNVMYDLRDRAHISKLADTAIGYGLTSPANMNSAGTRHIRQNIQFNCIPSDPSKFIDCWSHGYQNEMREQEFFSGDGPCEGDSGSGAFSQAQFDNGEFLSLGVLSRGGVTVDGMTCQGSFYTRLDSYRDLIISTANRAATLGGYTAPSWVSSPPIPPLSDGGTKPPADGGSSSDGGPVTPSPGELGAPCANDDECNSKSCSAIDGKAFVCTQSCDTANVCPAGFSCKSGFCFVTPPAASNSTQATGNSGGCAVAAPTKDPSKPIPWLIGIAGIALAGAALRRRR